MLKLESFSRKITINGENCHSWISPFLANGGKWNSVPAWFTKILVTFQAPGPSFLSLTVHIKSKIFPKIQIVNKQLIFLLAVELAMIMDRLYGGVCYAGIDTDPELKYPKGAGRVAFSNQQSYIAAISARFVQLQHGEIDKRVSFCKQTAHNVEKH